MKTDLVTDQKKILDRWKDHYDKILYTNNRPAENHQ